MIIVRLGLLLALAGAMGILFGGLMIPFTSGGWAFVAAAAGIAAGAVWASRGRPDLAVLPVAVCVLVSTQIVYGCRGEAPGLMSSAAAISTSCSYSKSRGPAPIGRACVRPRRRLGQLNPGQSRRR